MAAGRPYTEIVTALNLGMPHKVYSIHVAAAETEDAEDEGVSFLCCIRGQRIHLLELEYMRQ